MPAEAIDGKLRACPRGCLWRGLRIEVRFSSSKEAVVRLFVLAKALTNNYERFEALVDEGKVVGGGEVSE